MSTRELVAEHTRQYGADRYGGTTTICLYRMPDGMFLLHEQDRGSTYSDSLYEWSDYENESWSKPMTEDEARRWIAHAKKDGFLKIIHDL